MQYRNFAEHINMYGYCDYSNLTNRALRRDARLAIKATAQDKAPILGLLEQARHFIFLGPAPTLSLKEWIDRIPKHPDMLEHSDKDNPCAICKKVISDAKVEFDFPFPVIWMEGFGETPLARLIESGVFKEDAAGIPILEVVAGQEENIAGALLVEMAPTQFDIYLYRKYSGPLDVSITQEVTRLACDDRLADALFAPPVYEAMRTRIRELRSNKQYKETRAAFKVYPQEGGKRKLDINTVVYVGQSRDEASNTTLGREVEWSHSWEVMGHWRRVKGVGHDRTGVIITSGFTWVKPYVKGVGALVVKTRVASGLKADFEPDKSPG